MAKKDIKSLDDYRSKLSPDLQSLFDKAYQEQIEYYKNRNKTGGGGGLPPIGPQPQPLTKNPFPPKDSQSQNQQGPKPLTDMSADLEKYDVTKNPNYKKGYKDGIDAYNNDEPDPNKSNSSNQQNGSQQGQSGSQGNQQGQQGQGNQQGQSGSQPGSQNGQQGQSGSQGDQQSQGSQQSGQSGQQGNQQGQSGSQSGQQDQSGSQGGFQSGSQNGQQGQSGSQGDQQGQGGSQSGSEGDLLGQGSSQGNEQGQGGQANQQGQYRPKTQAELDKEAYEQGLKDGYRDSERINGKKSKDDSDSNQQPITEPGGQNPTKGKGSDGDPGGKGKGQESGNEPGKLEKGKWNEENPGPSGSRSEAPQGEQTTQSGNQAHIIEDLGEMPEIITPEKMREIRERAGYAKTSKKTNQEILNGMEESIQAAWASGRSTPGGFVESMARKIKERAEFEASVQPDTWRDQFSECVASCLDTFREPSFSRRRLARPEIYRETTYYKTKTREWQEPNKVQVIFLIDTSGSMGERRICQCISECMGILAEDVGVGKCQLAYYMYGLQGKWDRVRSIDLTEDDYDWADDPDSPIYPTQKDQEGGGTCLKQTLADCTLVNWTEYVGDDTWEIVDDEPCLDERTIFVIMTDGDDYIAKDIVPEEFEENKFIVLIISDRHQIEAYKKDNEDPKVLGDLDCDIIGIDLDKLKY